MKILQIYFGLFVFSILVSQSLMDFFSILVCGQWVWIYWQENRGQLFSQMDKLIPRFGLEKAWMVWILICILGFSFNWMSAAYAVERIIEFRWILVLYVMIGSLICLNPSEKYWKWLIGWFLVIGLGNLIIYFLDLPILQNLRYGSDNGILVRAGGFFGDPMTFSHSFVLLILFCVGLLFWGRRNFSKSQIALTALACALGGFGLFLTYTRGVWIGCVAALTIFLFFTRPVVALVFSVVVSLSFWIFYNHTSEYSDSHSRISQTLKEIKGQSERKVIWKTHFEIFKDYPILGAGYGQNSKLVPQYYARDGVPSDTLVSHAHNQYLHLAAGTGILGIFCYLFIWHFFFRNLIRLWKRVDLDSWDRGAVAGLIMGQIAFCVGSLTEANFERSKVRFMVMLIWAYGIYLANKYQILTLKGFERK